MGFEKLQGFLLWNLLINLAIYIIGIILVLSLRSLVCKMHGKLFGLNEDSIKKTLYLYFGIYKIFIIFFNIAPLIALQIIK
jgi:hypothetical protein